MLNGLFLTSVDGEVLLQKELLSSKNIWKPDVFISWLKKNKDIPHCIFLKNIFYINLLCDDVYIVAVTEDSNASPIIICEYLERLSELFKNLIGTVTANAILSNIGLAYEIISETNDAGSPKLMEISKLKPLLCNAVMMPETKSVDLLSFLPENLFGIVDKEKHQVSGEASKKPLYGSDKRSRKNTDKRADEMYVDLIEKLSVIINTDGSTALCNIFGKLVIKSYVENDASVSLTFPHCFENLPQVVTNPAIKLNNKSKSLMATVSPGSVDVLSYNTSDLGNDVSLPFTMYINITPNPIEKHLLLSLKIHCALPVHHPAVNIVGKIPLPNSILSITGTSSLKSITFQRNKSINEYIFSSAIFPGLSHHNVEIRMYLSSWTPVLVMEMTSVMLQFEVPMFCHSDMQITGLKVERINTTTSKSIDKWVRYLTFSHAYEFRINDDWFID